ncbi:hypothetical protein BFP70_13830 [Thioclava sp. SK-1]|nr:hypothetical protein BFP70_13830 [Thioclava sp. SK-1]
MSLEELKALQTRVTTAINTFEDRQRQAALAEMAIVAAKHGTSLEQLFKQSGGKKAKLPKPAKYKHPENPELTWSGFGRRPSWIIELVEQGNDLEDYAV